MRAKVIIPVLAFAIAILALAGWARFGAFAPTPPSPAPDLAANSSPTTPAVLRPPVAHRSAVVTPAPDFPRPEEDPVISEERQREVSARRADELADLAGTRRAGSLDIILSELSNRDAGIRRAALAAAVEFGDRGAIPALREAMDSNLDPQEKVNIQKAITYLQLPTLTEADTGLEAGAQPSVHSGAGE